MLRTRSTSSETGRLLARSRARHVPLYDPINWRRLPNVRLSLPFALVLLVIAGLPAALYGASHVSIWAGDFGRFVRNDGPMLADFQVPMDLPAPPDCRGTACEPRTANPTEPPLRPLAVTLQLPPVERFPWPAGFAFGHSGLANEPFAWRAVNQPQPGNAGQWRWYLKVDAGYGAPIRQHLYGVNHGGLVRRLVYAAGSGLEPVLLERLVQPWQDEKGKWQDDRPPFRPEQPNPVEIEFQPIPTPIALSIDGDPGYLHSGDAGAIRFDAPESKPADAIEVPGRVVAIRGSTAWFEPDETGLDWLRRYWGKINRSPLSDRATLQIAESLGGRTGRAVVVPASALVRSTTEGTLPEGEAIVWIEALGMAIPVHVRSGADLGYGVVVNEIQTPHAGAVWAAAWRGLPLATRAELHRMQNFAGAEAANLLLRLSSRILIEPPVDLRSGSSLRRHRT